MAYFRNMFTFLALSSTFFFACETYAVAGDGLVATELSPGGDITVPGEFPVYVPRAVEVLFSGLTTPQTITLSNENKGSETVVRIYGTHERSVRTIRLKPGTTAIYNFKGTKPVRLKAVNGDVKVKSLHPLKVQR